MCVCGLFCVGSDRGGVASDIFKWVDDFISRNLGWPDNVLDLSSLSWWGNHGNKGMWGFLKKKYYWLIRLRFTRLIGGSLGVLHYTWRTKKWPPGEGRMSTWESKKTLIKVFIIKSSIETIGLRNQPADRPALPVRQISPTAPPVRSLLLQPLYSGRQPAGESQQESHDQTHHMFSVATADKNTFLMIFLSIKSNTFSDTGPASSCHQPITRDVRRKTNVEFEWNLV